MLRTSDATADLDPQRKRLRDQRGRVPVSNALVELPGRGKTRVWQVTGPRDAPTLMLIHGVALTAEVNWATLFEPLGRHFSLVAPDLRGHGDGFPVGGAFRLEDCADDLAVLGKELELERFVAVGYSMGGLIAQLLFHRHPLLIDGLVLCCTARNFRGAPLDRLGALALPAMAATVHWSPLGRMVIAQLLSSTLMGERTDAETRAWAVSHMRRTDLTTILAAMQAVSEFTSHEWIAGIDVPTAVVIPTADRVVLPHRQHKLAQAIAGAGVFEVDADHGMCFNDLETFSAVVRKSCAWVAARSKRERVSKPLPAQELRTRTIMQDYQGQRAGKL
jgi:3-oxoadipate enol-lactonase